MVLGDQDLDVFLADGVDVTLGVTTTKGQLDDVEEIVLQGVHAHGSVGGSLGVIVLTGALPGLTVGSALTVNGLGMEVVDRVKIHEGRFTQLICRAA